MRAGVNEEKSQAWPVPTTGACMLHSTVAKEMWGRSQASLGAAETRGAAVATDFSSLKDESLGRGLDPVG